MYTKLYSFIFLLLSFIPVLLHAETFQPEQHIVNVQVSSPVSDTRYFSSPSFNEILKGNNVSDIAQDSKGMLWFGTFQGLYRYDGVRLLPLINVCPNILQFNHVIRGVHADNENNLWVITHDSLFKWSLDLEKMLPVRTSKLKKDAPFQYMRVYTADNEGCIWFGGLNKLYRYDSLKNEFIDYSHILPDETSILNQIYLDREGRLWVIVNQRIYRLQRKKSGQTVGEEWEIVQSKIFDKINEQHVLKVFQDSEGDFWVGLMNTNCALVHLYSSADGTRINRMERIALLNSEPYGVYSIQQYKNELYVATSLGLVIYSMDKRNYTLYQSGYDYREGKLNANKLRDLYVDREGGLWISTFLKGVNYYSSKYSCFKDYSYINSFIHGKEVRAICHDEEQNIWIAHHENILVWDRKKGQVKTLGNYIGKDISLAYNRIRTILKNKNNLFIGTYNKGLFKIDLTTGIKSQYVLETKKKRFFKSLEICDLILKDDSTLYVASVNGLYSFDIQSGVFKKDNKVRGSVRSFKVKDENAFWIMANNSILRLDKKAENVTRFTFNQNLQPGTLTVIGDMIYVGTNGFGLWKCKKTGDSNKFIKVEEFKDHVILSLWSAENTLWIATQKGLYSYDTVTRQVSFFNKRDGLKSQIFKLNMGVKTEDGLLTIVGQDGLVSFRPLDVPRGDVVPKVIMTDLFLNNKPVSVLEEGSPLHKAMTYTHKLTLHESDNNLAFRFTSSSFYNIQKNVFEYRLDPYDKNWVRNTETTNMAYYNNLFPGSYTLRVRTHNGDGNWSEEASVKLTVLPYWWKTPLMKIVYVALFILIIWGIFQSYRKHIQREQALIQLKREQELYQAKMNFFTYMVHEVRTPLTLIMGPLNKLLSNMTKLKEFEPDLNVMERNTQRLLMLVNKLMDLRKIEEKSYVIHLGAVEIRGILEQIVQDFSLTNSSCNLEFKVILPETECWAMVEREAFTKVCMNLLSNAYKFAVGEVKVTLSLSGDGTMWNLSVYDDGCGIAVENQNKIFDSYYQVGESQPNNYQGTGIGLFVVRNLVHLQHGKIVVCSEPNKGSTFTASFKKTEAPETLVEKKELKDTDSDRIESLSGEPMTEHKRLLIVEDNEDMRNYIASLLIKEYEVDQCQNGEEALHCISNKDYDMIITDLMMPVMDGISLIKSLKKNVLTSHIPVAILTAKADDASQIEGLTLYVDAYITKPFSAEVLLLKVKSIFYNREKLSAQFKNDMHMTSDGLCSNVKDKDFMTKVDYCILLHISDDKLSIDDIIAQIGIGRNKFYQKMKSITGMTPNDYLRTFRLKKAMELLQKGEKRVNEVCFYVGFSSPSYFTKCFTAQFNCLPSDVTKKDDY